MITDTGALAACEAMIGEHVAEAVAALGQAPITDEARAALAELAVAATGPPRLSGAPARPGLPQSARACARRFTSVPRCSVIA